MNVWLGYRRGGGFSAYALVTVREARSYLVLSTVLHVLGAAADLAPPPGAKILRSTGRFVAGSRWEVSGPPSDETLDRLMREVAAARAARGAVVKEEL